MRSPYARTAAHGPRHPGTGTHDQEVPRQGGWDHPPARPRAHARQPGPRGDGCRSHSRADQGHRRGGGHRSGAGRSGRSFPHRAGARFPQSLCRYPHHPAAADDPPGSSARAGRSSGVCVLGNFRDGLFVTAAMAGTLGLAVGALLAAGLGLGAWSFPVLAAAAAVPPASSIVGYVERRTPGSGRCSTGWSPSWARRAVIRIAPSEDRGGATPRGAP